MVDKENYRPVDTNDTNGETFWAYKNISRDTIDFKLRQVECSHKVSNSFLLMFARTHTGNEYKLFYYILYFFTF